MSDRFERACGVIMGSMKVASGDFVHFGKTAGDADEEHADAVGAHEGILKACFEAFTKEKAAQTAGENAGYVDKSAKSDHRAVSSLRG